MVKALSDCVANLGISRWDLMVNVLDADERAISTEITKSLYKDARAHPSHRQLRHPSGRFRASLFRSATPRRAKLGGRFF